MRAHDFRRIVLGMEGAVEGAHMGHPDFRVSNRIFAALYHDPEFGMVTLTPDQQEQFIRAHPEVFGMAPTTPAFSHRTATSKDLPELRALMERSIRTLIAAYLDEARVEASFEMMGVDTQLIEDRTYFVVEDAAQIVGCGGWSRRATLFGGDHTSGRDSRFLDPGTEPARVRAMYTDPDFIRRGVGRLVLSLCEAAARREGFRSLELVATVAGEPLYLACGFSVIERIEVPTSTGLTVPCARMAKSIFR